MNHLGVFIPVMVVCVGIVGPGIYLGAYASRTRNYIFQDPLVSSPKITTQFYCDRPRNVSLFCENTDFYFLDTGYCRGATVLCNIGSESFITDVYLFSTAREAIVSFNISLADESCNMDGETVRYSSNRMPLEATTVYIREHSKQCFRLYDFNCSPRKTLCFDTTFILSIVLMIFSGIVVVVSVAFLLSRKKSPEIRTRRPPSRISEGVTTL